MGKRRDEREESWQNVLGDEEPHSELKLIKMHDAEDNEHWQRTMEGKLRAQVPKAETKLVLPTDDGHGNADVWPENHDREGRQPRWSRQDHRGVSLDQDHAQSMPAWEDSRFSATGGADVCGTEARLQRGVRQHSDERQRSMAG